MFFQGSLLSFVKVFLMMYLFYVCTCTLSECTPACQERASGLIIDGYEPLCGCWELHSGPLEEQPMNALTH